MENQFGVYRIAMRQLQQQLNPYADPIVCVHCAGWRSFGGIKTRNVSMGPICICTAHWERLEKIVSNLKTKQVPINCS